MESVQILSDNKFEIDTSTSYEDSDENEYIPDNKKLKFCEDDQNIDRVTEKDIHVRLPTRQPKCFTKNAVMARQNRLRKKKYMQDLESQVSKLKHENKSLSSILNNQSKLIVELRRELKYTKSVLANSSDISKLLRLINNNTGMSVSTSLNSSLSLTSNCLSKKGTRASVGEATDLDDSLLIPDLGLFYEDFNEAAVGIKGTITEPRHSNIALKEHNYTTLDCHDEDAGVCLHVSKHRVSLEFCSICSNNAVDTWSHQEEER
ncbi:bzip transcription factor [Holotrichia oblita]|uniref:Bzip transcription factor n=1 Tax=Holotrichia oblita TaxID=644536 RepID=A0ACB9SYG4_HOLOL|nr:bzip transcription factor [Holotrichia oblita]